MNCAIRRLLRLLSPSLLLLLATVCFAQESDTTANTLSTVEVKAYGQVRRLKDVPAPVGYVGTETLNRFSNASVVQAVNTVAGVRMEERSPGSYRLNIRGSALRSPFGVRNVKIYYNDLPITDPGGQTYLNALGYYNFASIEILKGPGSSLYGAGTGGVLLIEGTTPSESTNVFGEYTVGSYNSHNAYVSVTTGNADNKSKVGFQHQSSDGFRYHSALKRDILSWNGNFRLTQKQALKTTFLYSRLFYETPGALTISEYNKDPKAYRPAVGGFPSAEESQAAVSQKMFLAGASFTQNFSSALTVQLTGYGAFTELRNPAVRNYGINREPHVGGRGVFTYKKTWNESTLNLSAGGELQQGFATATTLKNKAGSPDTLQTEDDIRIRQSFLFLQANLVWKRWEFTAGGSLNYSLLRFRRMALSPLPEQRKTLSDQLTPRFALARRFSGTTVYASLSKGFSPPTANELLPTGSAINLSLQAEQGWSYDAGIRGTVANVFNFDANVFLMRLKNTIIQRRDAGGGDYYINAGTLQKGLETMLNYSFLQKASFFRRSNLWLGYTYHHFRYKDFVQQTQELSGKALPGVAPHTVSSGLALSVKNGLLADFTYFYSSRIPLNDVNSGYANNYHLLGARVGYEKRVKDLRIKIALGADNILDQRRYSLGNDINAFGGRYYNAAPGRNYYTSLSVQIFTKKTDSESDTDR